VLYSLAVNRRCLRFRPGEFRQKSSSRVNILRENGKANLLYRCAERRSAPTVDGNRVYGGGRIQTVRIKHSSSVVCHFIINFISCHGMNSVLKNPMVVFILVRCFIIIIIARRPYIILFVGKVLKQHSFYVQIKRKCQLFVIGKDTR